MRATRALPQLLALSFVACTLFAGPDGALTGGVAPCAAGAIRCGDRCVSRLDPAFGCGDPACAPCAFPHATALCAAEGCAIAACARDHDDCDGVRTNGCEVALTASAVSCGRCGLICSASTPSCVDGACVPKCRAISLTATDAGLEAPSAGFELGTADHTLELWLQVHGSFGDSPQGALWTLSATASDPEPASNVSLRLNAGAAGQLTVAALYVASRLAPPTLDTRRPIPSDGAWHHVAFVRSAGTVQAYVDGAPSGGPEALPVDLFLARRHVAIGSPDRGLHPAAPVRLGPMRVSTIARYSGPFAPRTFWPVDQHTVAQWLSTRAFDGTRVVDEAGRDDDALAVQHVDGWTETSPCP